ncbi:MULTISPECIES: inorganic phosphate transporter [Pantoea]|jgi:PiT family inorganic phosphate transporter|uniref:inorganic phosphate transporter n=1 Tax=Pantoea TaxID=53335 RepID=UPI000EA27917|nr:MULTISPECIES: inorganic phosphate transporter [Pantoea]MBZ6384327.1 inorganic phosphate transporter [Pantoea piersonii]MBZ6398589.1 inorganic phosphate transporter [Pantoea piersonii]MBZ6406412.1 inorganic phosphate transporter [Pantoea piersonii]MBZ6425158.1 inorganic phosphate transporter [Pantoea piersonii]NYB02671.1 inorganic phosphate transporter [Pantoea piersonii]
MSDYVTPQALNGAATPFSPDEPHTKKQSNKPRLLFIVSLIFGVLFTGTHLAGDIQQSGLSFSGSLPLILLAIALLAALGFEFVNGFHDTANAVATVIYTRSLSPTTAVVLSGVFNFLGVLFSSGAVAFGIISLLPVELILQAGSSESFAMIYALLFAAIIWNLATWWLGLPASSSHTLIGAIIGVGVANAMMHGRSALSGVNWGQAMNIGKALLLSPVVGFACAALLLVIMKQLIKKPALYQAPKNHGAPPLWIRSLMVLSCTGVSFAHGSNDGQKGMGLIMLILVAALPVTYSLNRAEPQSSVPHIITLAQSSQQQLQQLSPLAPAGQPHAVLTAYLRTGERNVNVLPALAQVAGNIGATLNHSGSMANLPAGQVPALRNEMYLAAETIKHLQADATLALPAATRQNLQSLRSALDAATQFIPAWVKIAVALALGLGTMVGWRRIVATLGEKIGKHPLNYAQGVSAQLVAMGTIGAADAFGMPVSTTHVLSSGIAGTMAANRSGLQLSTLRNMALAWVLTLPAAALLSAVLYWLLISL